MGLDKHHLPVEGTWHTCPDCGYQDGWHVFFKRVHGHKAAHMGLQCPGCKKKFDLGLRVDVVAEKEL